MKKKIAIVLVGMMCVSATGCSMFNKNSGVDLTEISAEDIFTDISEESTVEGSEAAEAFSNAMTSVNESTDITIKVNNSIVMGTEGEADYQNSLSESEVKLAMDGETQIGNVVINNTYSASDESGETTVEKNNITGYFDGASLFFITNDGDKVKEDMGYEDFLSVVNTYSLSIYNDCISKAARVENGSGSTYYISYDPSLFETTMNTNMEASGQTMADGEAMQVNYANIIAKFDADNNLTSYGFVIDAEYVSDTGSLPYSYTIEADFSDRASTKVEAASDLDDYMTADEYTQKMQEEAASAENNAEGADLDVAGGEEATDASNEAATN